MTSIQVGCNLSYTVAQDTYFLFNIAAARTLQQTLGEENLQLNPNIPVETFTIGTEGLQVYRLFVELGELQIQYHAQVLLQPDVYDPTQIAETGYQQLPYEVLPYLNPSRYCESDRLTHFAMRQFGDTPQGYGRVTAICDWINSHLDYQAGSSGESTSACDVLIQRVGVCRDYAHLAIALCRALCIPARYISGYAVDLQPPDFHGLFEAYLGSRWYLFDATRMAPIAGFVRIGTGRDAADASFATIIGAATLTTMSVYAKYLP
jgi:transglutaminase-like putative cysteine protease